MAELDKTQQQILIKALGHLNGQAILQCDNDKILLRVRTVGRTRTGIHIFIRNKYHCWVTPENSKYLRPQYYRFVASDGRAVTKDSGITSPIFMSPRTAIRHLCKVSKNIQILGVSND